MLLLVIAALLAGCYAVAYLAAGRRLTALDAYAAAGSRYPRPGLYTRH